MTIHFIQTLHLLSLSALYLSLALFSSELSCFLSCPQSDVFIFRTWFYVFFDFSCLRFKRSVKSLPPAAFVPEFFKSLHLCIWLYIAYKMCMYICMPYTSIYNVNTIWCWFTSMCAKVSLHLNEIRVLLGESKLYMNLKH